MLKYDSRTDTLMWGRSYFLEMEENNNRKIYWTPLKAVTPYTWYRCDDEADEDEAEEDEEDEEDEDEENWDVAESNVPILQQVVGSWRDADGTTYKITLDASGSSCSAMIQAPDGALYEAKEDIICEDQGLWWNSYYLDHVKSGGSRIRWTCTESGKGFWWKSIPEKAAKSAPGKPAVLSTSVLKSLLGEWRDEEDREYLVSLDASGDSCTVEIRRPNGSSFRAEGVLKYSKAKERVMWGRSYYLEVRSAGDIVWTHTGRGKPFRWLARVPEATERRKTFRTDEEISAQKTLKERELQRWEGPEGIDEPLEELSCPREWDQFKANAELFGYVSTYKEDMSQYSTKIDATKMPSGWRKKAERVATEIEGQEGASPAEESVDAQVCRRFIL